MTGCKFYVCQQITAENFSETAASVVAGLYRSHYRQFGRILVMADSPALFSREIWKTPGFVPNATADDPSVSAAPVAVSDGYVPGYGIIVNTRLNLSLLPEEVFSCSLLADFSLKAAPDLLPACRSRYKQIRRHGAAIENITTE